MPMHEIVLILHSYIRLRALGGGLLVLCVSAAAWWGKRPWTRTHASILKIWVAAFDAQVLLGLSLYLWLSPTAIAARRAGLAAIKSSIVRFWLMEHAVTMIIAAIVLHLGTVWVRRVQPETARHRRLFAIAIATLVLVMGAVPWPGKASGRPLARGTARASGLTSCAEPRPEAQRLLPSRLSETGLYGDIATKRIADTAVFYQPRFALWSD